MSERKAMWTGHIRRGATADSIVGTLRDEWGWEMDLEGARDPSGGYRIVVYRTERVPENLKQPAIDDEGTA